MNAQSLRLSAASLEKYGQRVAAEIVRQAADELDHLVADRDRLTAECQRQNGEMRKALECIRGQAARGNSAHAYYGWSDRVFSTADAALAATSQDRSGCPTCAKLLKALEFAKATMLFNKCWLEGSGGQQIIDEALGAATPPAPVKETR